MGYRKKAEDRLTGLVAKMFAMNSSSMVINIFLLSVGWLEQENSFVPIKAVK